MEHVLELMKELSQSVMEVAQSDVVLGNAMELGNVTVIPISRVAAGFGAGGGDVTDAGDSGAGAGTGGGANVRPIAVIAITPEGVEVLKIGEKQGRLEELLERIPDLVERFKAKLEVKS